MIETARTKITDQRALQLIAQDRAVLTVERDGIFRVAIGGRRR